MRWSIRLPEPSSGWVPAPAELVHAARSVEAAGFDAGWITDHPFPVVRPGQPGHHTWDPLAGLAFLASATDRLLLHANLVVLPYRNPFLAAKGAATVAQLSSGRLLLTVGAGYLEPEFAALGVELSRRRELTAEGVEAMCAAWSGAPLERSGSGWVASGNTMLPAVRPRALWRGGNSRAAIEHAATACDGWAPFEVSGSWSRRTRTAALAAGDGLRERIALYRELLASAGRLEAGEIVLTRADPSWLDRPAAEVREEVAGLEELGVGWIAASFTTATASDFERGLERFAAVVR
jgi:probable F420-dependent oxidoreductase